jgi:hypothetical protein
MTFQEIQEKLKKCELALTSIKDGSYSNTNYTKEEALQKFNTIKESLEKKLNLLKEEETMFVSTKGGDTKAVSMDTKAAMDLKKDPNITGITTAKGKDLKEDDLSDEEQEEITTETSHTEVVAKEVHKALIEALQETGHEISEDKLSSLNPETFTITVKFKDNTQSDYSFEFIAGEVKLDGNIIVTTNKKGVTPILNKTIAKDNLIKYFKNLSEKKGKDHDGDGKIDSKDYLLARDKAIKTNVKEDESEPVVDKKGKYTGVRRLKLSDKDKATLKKIEDLLAKEKSLKEIITYKDRELSHEEVDRLDLIAHKEFGGKDFSQLSDEDKEKVFAKRGKVGVEETKDAQERKDHHYIKVPRREYKKAMSILDGASDGNFVKMDFVDDDGAGNVIIYFEFSDGYIASGQANAYMYDAVSDLQAQDVTISDHSAELDEALDINDPALMAARVAKMRADDMKKLDALKKSPEGKAAARAQASAERKEIQARALVQKLKAKRAEIEREMENDPDIEPQGGPVADMYGDQLNKIDNAIEKAASVYNKPMDYDTAVGKVTEDEEETDYVKRRKEDDDYYEDPDYYKESMKEGRKDNDALYPDNPRLPEIKNLADKIVSMVKAEAAKSELGYIRTMEEIRYQQEDDFERTPEWNKAKGIRADFDDYGSGMNEVKAAKVQKAYGLVVAKMKELAKQYKAGDKSVVPQLKDLTAKKKALEADLERAVAGTHQGQELTELSTDQRNELVELQNILDDVAQKGEEAREIIRQSFPRMLSKADAYGAFEFGSSANRYDTTLESIIEEIEEYYDEEEDDMDENKKPLKENLNPEVSKKVAQFIKGMAKRYDYSEQDAVFAIKQALRLRATGKEELKEEMDGGRLFDHFKSKGYDITERRPDGVPFGVQDLSIQGYMVSKGEGRYPQSVIFQYNKAKDQFTISRMSGYRIDQKEALKAGMREAGRSGAVGIDSYMTDGNYTPVDISAEGLKDIVDHVMTGLDREGKAQSDFYKDRGRTSGTVDEQFKVGQKVTYLGHPAKITLVDKDIMDRVYYSVLYDKGNGKTKASNLYNKGGEIKALTENKATCCGRCGRVHVKGSGCKRPYLKGKSHCRNK